MSSVPTMIWAVLFILVASVVFIKAFEYAMSGPTVYESWTTKQCQQVVNSDGSAGDCSNIPKKYHRVWSY